MLRLFLFALAFVLTAGTAFASTDYYWIKRGVPDAHFSSASAACPAVGGYFANNDSKFDHVEIIPEGSAANCYYMVDASGNGQYTYGPAQEYVVDRVGDSCPTGSTYDATTGSCSSSRVDGESCKETINGVEAIWDANSNGGECVPWVDTPPRLMCPYLASHSTTPTNYTVAGNLDQQGMPTAPPTFTTQGMSCEMGTVTSEECTINIKGAISCNVTAIATGKVGQGDGSIPLKDAICSEANPCPEQVATTDKKSEPCVITNGACTSTESTSTTGKLSCGSIDGESVCIISKPKSTETTTKSTETAKSNSDGSVTTTRTDNATKTTCTDVNTCTSKTSTTTTTTATSASGQTTSTSTKCSGDCGGTKASGTGSGDNGDGTGDDDEGNTAEASDDCKTTPPCDGDVFMCANLQQQWVDSCASRALPTDAEKAELQTKIDIMKGEIAVAQADLDNQANTLISQFEGAAAGGGSGKCFSDADYSIHGYAVKVPFSKVCDLLYMFRYALLLIAYIIAARMLMKEF